MSYVYLGGLVEGAVGVDVVIKNNDSDHDPHAKQERVLAAETTRIFPKYTERGRNRIRKGTNDEMRKIGSWHFRHIICW